MLEHDDGYLDGLLLDGGGGCGAGEGEPGDGEAVDPVGEVEVCSVRAAVSGSKRGGRVASIADKQPRGVAKAAALQAVVQAAREETAAFAKAAGFLWVEFPMTSIDEKTGKVKVRSQHIENTRAMLAAYGVTMKFNEMSHLYEFTGIPGLTEDRTQEVAAAWITSRAQHHGLSPKAVEGHVALIATPYHPVRDWIASKTWDGQDRFGDVMESLTLREGSNAGLVRTYLQRWMVTLCRFLERGSYAKRPAAQGVLVLLGPQGIAKTRWLQSLVPVHMMLTGRLIDPTDRDSIQQATSVAVCELGELDGSFARKQGTMPAIKAFVTRPDDIYRSAYARREETFPRRTIFCASVNHRVFLDDDTGNRRWWVVEVQECDPQHGIDIQQLWAQAAALSARGEAHWLLPDEQGACNETNEAYQPVDYLEQEVREKFEPDPNGGWMTYTEIAAKLPRFTQRPPTKAESGRIGEVLDLMGCRSYRSKTSRGRKCRVKVYAVDGKDE